MKVKIVSVYSIIHFIVDLACCVLVVNVIQQKIDSTLNVFICMVIYNFFAFAMQFPIGIIADKINKNALFSAIGCLLVVIAYGLSDFGIIACLVAGIGNSMFHIGGGIDVLNISNKKAALSGIFVSTGALGIFLGGKSLEIGFNRYYIIILATILSAIVLFWLDYNIKDKVNNEEVIIPKIKRNEIIAIICLIITVCIRSYVGLILAFEWKNTFVLALLSVLAVVFGKMIGGFIGDKIGFIKSSLISLIVSAFLYIFAFNNSVIGILAILFFNMTMPITLTAISNILNNNKGMAFGFLTLALFIGAIPVFLGYTKKFFNPQGLFIITIISAIILYVGIKKYNNFMEKTK